MFYQRSHWISLLFGVGAIYLWTLFEIYGTVGIVGIIVALIVGGMLGRSVWAAANALTNDWLDNTHVVPGLLIGLLISAVAGLWLEASEILPGSLFYVTGAGGLLGIVIGLGLDAKARRD
jgi:hypothetical protein